MAANGTKLTTLQFWRTYCKQIDTFKRNKQAFQGIMPKENKVCFFNLNFKKTEFKHVSLMFSLLFLNV